MINRVLLGPYHGRYSVTAYGRFGRDYSKIRTDMTCYAPHSAMKHSSSMSSYRIGVTIINNFVFKIKNDQQNIIRSI